MKFALLFYLLSLTAMAVSPMEKRLVDAYQAREENGDLVGLALGVIGPNEKLSLKFGEAQTSEKAFEIGSISKTFTGIALGLLVDQNKLNLNLPLSTYLPELAGSYVGNLTISQVGTHMGKLPRDMGKATEGKLLAFLRTYEPEENFPAVQYSNLGYCLLTLIVERVSQVSYEEFIRNNILKPLGMKQTGFLTSEEVFPLIITPHNLINEIAIYDVLSDLNIGSGGIYSSLEDMMKILQSILSPSTVPSLKDAIQISQQSRIGWDHQEGDGIEWKNGGMSGFSSFMGIRTQKKTGTIVLNNTFNGKVTQDMAMIALGYDMPLKKDIAPSAEFKTLFLGTYHLEGDDYSYELVERNAGHLGIRVIRSDGSLDYVLKIQSFDGKNFKLASAWYSNEDVIFDLEPETGKVRMSVKSDFRTDIYYK